VLVVVAAFLIVVGITVAIIDSHTSNESSVAPPAEGSGVAVTSHRAVPRFEGVELGAAASVNVRQGPRAAVVVRADDNLVDRVTTAVRGGELAITTHGSFTTATPIDVDVTTPSLRRVSLTGTGTIAVEDVDSPDLVLETAGTGRLTASGRVDHLRAELTGFGQMDLRQLVAHDAVAEVSGTGVIVVYPTDSLDASVSGVGSIVVAGHPHRLSEHVSGAGAITHEEFDE